MVDMTKCNGEDCSMKEHCYRHKAPENGFRQSYFIESPTKGGKITGEECIHFIEDKQTSYGLSEDIL